MPSDRKPTLILPVAVTLTVLLGLYVGAYYAMVEPDLGWGDDGFTGIVPDYPTVTRHLDPFYDTDFTVLVWCHRLFAPIHWLDRRVRPHVWEPSS